MNSKTIGFLPELMLCRALPLLLFERGITLLGILGKEYEKMYDVQDFSKNESVRDSGLGN